MNLSESLGVVLAYGLVFDVIGLALDWLAERSLDVIFGWLDWIERYEDSRR